MTQVLPKTNFDKVLDGLTTLLVPAVTAIAIKVVFRGNRA